MRAIPLWVLLSLVAAGAARAEEAKDLSYQFPDPPMRYQGDVGSCHDFASVALLEAALYRRHGPLTGPGADALVPWVAPTVGAAKGKAHLRLSEADLFVRRTVASAEYFQDIGAKLGGKTAITERELEDAVLWAEAGSPQVDLVFAVRFGIAKDETAPWSKVVGRYYAYRRSFQDGISSASAQAQRKMEFADEVDAQAGRDGEALGRDEESGYTDNTGAYRRAAIADVKGVAVGMREDAALDFKGYLAKAAGQNTRQAETELLGDIPALDSERAWVQALLRGFTVQRADFPLADAAARADKTRCRAAGAAAKAAILARLRKDIPVALSMDLAGLAAWDQAETTGRAMHAFALSGFTTGADGRTTFLTRNSWRKNPPVPEEDLCRVAGVIVLLSDREE